MSMHDLPLEARTLAPILLERARTEGDRPYLTSGGRTYSFRETVTIVHGLARGLRRLGVEKGNHVALLLPNGAEFVFTWYACCVVGAVMVPINTSYTGQLLEYVLRDSGSRGLVVTRDLLPALATIPSDVRAGLAWSAVVGGVDELELPIGPGRYVDYESVIEMDGPDPTVPTDFRDVHCVMYTSGTTGPSKGVVMPNGHFFSSTCTFLRAVGLERDDVLFTPLPLFHGVGSRLGVLPAFMVGAHVVIAERFSASRFWEQATTAGATVAHTIFTIPPILKAQAPSQWDRAHRLRAMYNAHHDDEFEARFNVRLVEAYGQTETGLTIYTRYPERRHGTAGRIHEDWEVRLVDEWDRPVADGDVGEILLRPRRPSIMMRGYLNKPAETLATLRDLWFHTGDFASRDADGYFTFAGRKKERIRRRGENISSWEIEKVVDDHPDIVESAAVGHPAAAGEDDIRVVAILRPGATLTAEALVDWLRERLPRFMVPRYVEFVDDLPRTPSNKVEKHVLITQGLATSAWDRESAARSA